MSGKKHLIKTLHGPMHQKRAGLNPREDQVQFCDCCITMTMTVEGLRLLKSASGYRHHNRDELAIYARRGCPFCFWIYFEQRHLWEYESPGRLHMFATKSEKSNVDEWDSRRIIAKVLVTSTSSSGICLPSVGFKVSHNLEVFETTHALQSFLEARQTKSSDMASSEAMQRARQFLERCQKSHPKCSRGHDPILPTRVIDVGFEGDPAIKLHISQAGERGQYLALSYCWGGPQQYETTQKTIEDHCQAIPLQKLSRTIQYAVRVTRQIGFKFLWIDALCILQNCKFDKDKEISHMGELYKNATLTLAARNASTVRDGFLYNIPCSRSFQVPIRMHNGTFAGLKVSFIGLVDSMQSGKKSLNSEWHEDPLDERGWTLQECLLSCRLLAYGSKEMTWQCQTDFISKYVNRENGRRPLPSGILEPGLSIVPEIESKMRQTAIWHRIVEDYSGRRLTFTSDRMPAISGIATELALCWRDTYHAGMWGNSLVQDLAWRLEKSSSGGPMDIILDGPSWSWISHTAKVSFLHMTDVKAEVTECTTRLLNPNAPYSVVSSGRLTIRACFQTMASTHTMVEQRKPADNDPATGFFFDDGSTYEYFNVKKANGMEQIGVLILGFWKARAVGLIIEDVGDTTYKRLGMWVSPMMKPGLHQFHNPEFTVGIDDSYERGLFTII